MNIIERGRAFLQSLRELAGRTAWDWRRCPHCGQTLTSKWGSYTRHPWTLVGRQVVRVQRHRCEPCSATQGRHVTYSEEAPWLVRGSWYAREVQRCALDHWLHLGVSVRRTAAVLRSWLGKQERWRLWRALEVSPPPDDATACHLSGSTVQRWLDRAGAHARQTLPAQLAGVPTSGQLGTDGLWARLRGDTTRVVLLLTDSVTGVVWPPVVALGEASPLGWGHLVRRARLAGLVVTHVHGIVSDGATGLEAYRRRALAWVSHQRCVFHLWRGLAGELAQQARAAAANLTGAAAKQVRTHTRRTLVALIHAVLDAPRGPPPKRRWRRSPRTNGGPSWPGTWRPTWTRRWCTNVGTTRACCGSAPSGAGATSAYAPVMGATTPRTGAWSGRPWSGPSTTTSSPRRGGVSANASTGTPASARSPSPACPQVPSAISTPWASNRPARLRRARPLETAHRAVSRPPCGHSPLLSPPTRTTNSPTQGRTESGTQKDEPLVLHLVNQPVLGRDPT